MFAKSDGPTSLRLDLVWALAFSIQPVAVETSSGRRPCEAGMAAVWTGAKGEVVVVIRQLTPAAVARYAFTEPIDSVEDLDLAVESALGFVGEMGFFPDQADFRSLPAEFQRERLERWDRIRKVRKSRRGTKTEPEPPTQGQPLDGASAAPAPEETRERARGGDPARSVLGRIPLVRRDSGGKGLDPLGRLLSFF